MPDDYIPPLDASFDDLAPPIRPDLEAKFDALPPEALKLFEDWPKRKDTNFRKLTDRCTLALHKAGFTLEEAIELAPSFPRSYGVLDTYARTAIFEGWKLADELAAERAAEEAEKQADGVASGLIEVFTPSQISQEQARPYVVKGLIARGDHIISMGHPGSGKSVIAPHVAYAVAQGHEVFGRRVKAGPVIYLASEDGHGMKNRVRALLKRYGDAPNFHLVPVPLDLMNDGPSRNAVMDLVERIKPALIVIDTLSRSFPGLRENESEDMGRVVQVVREMTAICGSAVWSIHHVAKDGGRTPRGHGSLEADADMTMLIGGNGAETRTITLGKNRNGASDLTLAFNIEVDELGLDEDGDPITAPIAAEADPETLKPSGETKLGDKPALLLRVLSNMDPALIEDIRPDPAMPVCKAVLRSNLRKALIAQAWFPESVVCDEGLSGLKLLKPGYPMENNGLSTLKRKRFINFNRDWIWLVSGKV